MNRLKFLSYLLAIFAIVLATGTGAFGATTVDRETEVAVVDDSQAFLSLTLQEPTVTHGPSGNPANRTPVALVTIENRFDAPITSLTVRDVSKGTPHVVGHRQILDTNLEVGESTTVTAPVACRGKDRRTVELVISATTATATVEKTKSITLECNKSDTNDDSTVPENTTTAASD